MKNDITHMTHIEFNFQRRRKRHRNLISLKFDPETNFCGREHILPTV